jgi:hypothetical protein
VRDFYFVFRVPRASCTPSHLVLKDRSTLLDVVQRKAALGVAWTRILVGLICVPFYLVSQLFVFPRHAFGCVLIREVRFFLDDPADPPPAFAPNVVQGRSYDLADPAWSDYFTGLLQRLLGGPAEVDLAQPWGRPGPVYGDPRLAPYRLGQQAFRAVVLDAYDRH